MKGAFRINHGKLFSKSTPAEVLPSCFHRPLLSGRYGAVKPEWNSSGNAAAAKLPPYYKALIFIQALTVFTVGVTHATLTPRLDPLSRIRKSRSRDGERLSFDRVSLVPASLPSRRETLSDYASINAKTHRAREIVNSFSVPAQQAQGQQVPLASPSRRQTGSSMTDSIEPFPRIMPP